MIKGLLIGVLIFLSPSVLAQNNSTAFLNRVIQSAQDQFKTLPSNQIEHLKKFHIDELQFRTQTDEFDFDRQEYTMRLRPGNFRMAAYQKELYEAYEKKARLSTEERKADGLFSAYELWMNHQLNLEELSLKKRKTSLLKDKIKVYNKQLDLSNFNIIRYIDTEDDLNRLEIDIKQLNWRIDNQARSIYGETKPYIDLDKTLISIEKIKTLINAGEELVDNQSLASKILDLDKLITQKEIDMENAETKQMLDFVQLRYGGPHDDPLREKVRLAVGINLPTKSRNKLKINELLLEQLENEYEFQADIERQKINGEIAKEILQEELALYQLVIEQNKSSILKNQTIMQRIESSSSTSPLELLDIKILALEKEERLFEIRKDLFDAYLEWLEASGRSTALPFKNYLDENLETLNYDPGFW